VSNGDFVSDTAQIFVSLHLQISILAPGFSPRISDPPEIDLVRRGAEASELDAVVEMLSAEVLDDSVVVELPDGGVNADGEGSIAVESDLHLGFVLVLGDIAPARNVRDNQALLELAVLILSLVGIAVLGFESSSRDHVCVSSGGVASSASIISGIERKERTTEEIGGHHSKGKSSSSSTSSVGMMGGPPSQLPNGIPSMPLAPPPMPVAIPGNIPTGPLEVPPIPAIPALPPNIPSIPNNIPYGNMPGVAETPTTKHHH